MRWLAWVALLVILGTLILPGMFSRDDSEEITYSRFLDEVSDGTVLSVEINNSTGDIRGELGGGEAFRTTGPRELPPEDYALLRDRLGASVEFTKPSSSIWGTLLPLLLPVGLLILFFWWMQRRAQGQMGGIMSIGRSRAKTYSTERPATTFDDVAGYEGVKREITEVVNFLREPEKFARIGARIPKGILLVGPPGTGKTLIARAVAGEAGVPFSFGHRIGLHGDVRGRGASRVRDLFNSAPPPRWAGHHLHRRDRLRLAGKRVAAGAWRRQ